MSERTESSGQAASMPSTPLMSIATSDHMDVGSQTTTDSESMMNNYAGLEVAKLPRSVKRRVKALKRLQRISIDAEAEFYKRIEDLEFEFAERLAPLLEMRKSIVIGELEPSEEECDFPILHGLTAEQLQLVEEAGEAEPLEGTVGIPEFWLTVMKNALRTQETIKPADEAILKYLLDISTTVSRNPNSFTLSFHFAPNEYFKQTILEKKYILNLDPDEEDPFAYDGATVSRTEGTVIEWKSGKDVTKKVVLSKQRSGSGGTRMVTKVVKNESFFNFFDPPVVTPKGEGDSDDEDDSPERNLLVADFELGQYLRDQVIPHAVLFFTGEQVVESDDEESEEDDDDEDDEGSDEDESEAEEDDVNPESS